MKSLQNKPGRPRRFRRGNLAVVDPPPPMIPNTPDILAVWDQPPMAKGPHVIGHLNKNDVILILDIWNIDQHIQYSRIFSCKKNTIGWANSKFLRKIQR